MFSLEYYQLLRLAYETATWLLKTVQLRQEGILCAKMQEVEEEALEWIRKIRRNEEEWNSYREVISKLERLTDERQEEMRRKMRKNIDRL